MGGLDLWHLLAGFSFCTGAVIASFLNVVIWRIPRGESIVSPPSHCPKCNARIRWYQNIPIISWLALRGKCANCKAPISPRYIIIEAIGGALFLSAFVQQIPHSSMSIIYYGTVVKLLMLWTWFALMIVGSMIDFDHKLLPDFVTIGGMVLGVAFHAFAAYVLDHWFPLIYSMVGLTFGFVFIWLLRWLGTIAFKREAMGMGDVLLMGAVGAISGIKSIVFVLIVSSVLGAVIGSALLLISKKRLRRGIEIPYGPYICAAHLFYCFYGYELVDWYVRLVR